MLVRSDYMSDLPEAFVALAVLGSLDAFVVVLSPLLLLELLLVLAALLLVVGLAEALVEPFSVDFVEEDLAADLALGVDAVLFAALEAEVFVVGLAAAVDRDFFASAAGFSAEALEAGAAAGLVFAGAALAAAVVAVALAAVAAGRDFALAGPDMVMTAVVTVTTRATESRRTRFMGVFFPEQKDETGGLLKYPLKAI